VAESSRIDLEGIYLVVFRVCDIESSVGGLRDRRSRPASGDLDDAVVAGIDKTSNN
jgi:hypothetical protein